MEAQDIPKPMIPDVEAVIKEIKEKNKKRVLRKPAFIKVVHLKEGMDGFNMKLKVMKNERRIIKLLNGEEKHSSELVAGDTSGTVELFLKGKIVEELTIGAIFEIRNGFLRKEDGRWRIEVDKFGKCLLIAEQGNWFQVKYAFDFSQFTSD